jgi:hypothetical protein
MLARRLHLFVLVIAGILLIGLVTHLVSQFVGEQAGAAAAANHIAPSDPISPDGQTGGATGNYLEAREMLRGYCFAGSAIRDQHALGGFGPSDNVPKRVLRFVEARGLYLLAQPTIETRFGAQPGMRVVLVNGTSEVLSFSACDSRIDLVQEARDESGRWRPIEYLPRSWCGNSYHRVFLPPREFWQFPAPRYRGPIATRLRFALTLSDKSRVVSNEFEGSVFLDQFSKKQGHNPNGLMDPYDE